MVVISRKCDHLFDGGDKCDTEVSVFVDETKIKEGIKIWICPVCHETNPLYVSLAE